MSGVDKKHNGAYTKRNRVQLLSGGKSYFDLLEHMIDAARHSVLLQIYIFDDDETGIRIGNALIRAAKRGAAVYLLVDGYASQHIAAHYIRKLRAAGVHFRFFEPLFRSLYFYVGRRMHQKAVVTDARYALIGSVNIANRYNDFPGAPAWMDTALYIEGEAAVTLFNTCCAFWGRKLPETLALPEDLNTFLDLLPADACCSVRIRHNDWLKRKSEIWKSYYHLFNQATESITIMCSYFLPGRSLRKALTKAAARGVNVKVILAGLSDVPLAKSAEWHLYDWLLSSGIDVYEYQPTVLHAKIAVVDNHWVTIGSYNVNNISAYASIELNADVRNRAFAKHASEYLEAIIAKDCEQVTLEKFKPHLGQLQRMIQKFSYTFIEFVLSLFTFYFKRED